MRRGSDHGIRNILMMVSLALLLPQICLGETSGACLRAEVPAPIILPDGSVEPAGLLEICLTRMYSPVAGLHKTSVDGRDLGLFISRRESAEAASDDRDSYFVFIKRGDGELQLESYGFLDGDEHVTYTVAPGPRVRSTWQVERASTGPGPARGTETTELILLAANTR